MIGLLLFGLVVVVGAIIAIYVCDLLIGMLPSAPSQLGNIIRIIIVLIALLIFLQRALPMIVEARLL